MREALITTLNRMGDVLWNIFNIIGTVSNFIVNLLTFIINTVSTLIKYVGRVFTTIFTDGFFNTIHVGLGQLEVYLGTVWTNVLIVLLVIAFSFIVFGFIMRLMKGQLHYYNTEKKLKKFE